MRTKCLLYLAAVLPCTASFETLFTLGEDDDHNRGFSRENRRIDPAPGSPTEKDDHFYVGNEILENFERALTTSDPTNVLHFPLTATQARNTGILKVRVDLIWGGADQGAVDTHEVSFSLNGGAPFHVTPIFEDERDVLFKVSLTNETVNAGDNLLRIERTGGSDDTWLQFDYIEVSLDPTALRDSDNDQIPLYWEELYLLSDDISADAVADPDGDGLTNLEEFQKKTNPRLADTDGDGLNDGDETVSDPLNPDTDQDGLADGLEITTSPVLADTDSDGASDSWEIATGYDPNMSSSTPPAWAGSIGINFRSQEDETLGLWSAQAPNGYMPQLNWNHTEPLRSYGVSRNDPLLSGDQSTIFMPNEGAIVNSAGQVTPLTLAFTNNGVRGNGGKGNLAADLLNGYLYNDQYENDADEMIDRPSTVTLSNIPFSNYHLYVYLSAEVEDREAFLRLNGDAQSDVTFRPVGVGGIVEFRPYREIAGPVPAPANVVVFKNLSGNSQSLELYRIRNSSGIAAVQLVDIEADSDNDDLPDYWEFIHRTGAGQANAGADPDGDGLNHGQEFASETDPNEADSDHDGLNDKAEVDAGTKANFGDSDGDGISDYEELFLGMPSDPLLANSDSDNLTDSEERENYSDPQDGSIAKLPYPAYPASGQFHWEDNDVQIMIDHSVPRQTGGGTSRDIFRWQSRNLTAEGYQLLRFTLRERDYRLHYDVSIARSGGFNREDGGSLSSRSDNEDNVYATLGFSGRGTHDTSDPLTFRFSATQSGGQWNASYTIINQTTGNAVVERTFENVTPNTQIANGTAKWGWSDEEDRSDYDLGYGVRVFRSKTSIDTLPEFSAHRDTDNDGMSDTWELLHNLDPNSAADASLDADSDDLSNVDEFEQGTLPREGDSDGDGISDLIELNLFSDPRSPASRPAYFTTIPSNDVDLNNNGLSDIWESLYQSTGLVSSGDPDGDGFSNLEESMMGTDPTDGSSFFKMDVTTNGGVVTLEWPRISTKTQSLLSSDNLTGFSPHGEAPLAQGNLYSLSTPAGSQNFFKVTLRDMDTDGDGLSNWEEATLGAISGTENSVGRPMPIDRDGNGIPDDTLSSEYVAFLELMQDRENLISGATATGISARNAARLLLQASFGPTTEAIREVQEIGIAAWIDDQIDNQPITRHGDYIKEITADFEGARVDLSYRHNLDSREVSSDNIRTSFARAAISGPDQLRQRVAFALSEILVVSRQDSQIGSRVHSMPKYYDMLVEQSFGNFEDLLMDVTMSPIMGWYLSSVGNQKADPSINRFPDENYAREIQQLFSIGLWELNMDGTRKLDAEGQSIPTYTNDDITEFARVFTGQWYGNQRWGRGGYIDSHYSIPMEMHPEYHDFEAKTLLNGFTIPRREATAQNGLQDIRDTVQHLVTHPTCAPFISKQLIQFLVTSNPSPAYVERVATVFAGNGTRRAGDLKATIKAILLDPEARDPGSALAPNFGIFREPVIRHFHMARLLKLNRSGNLVWWDYGNFFNDTLQLPLYSTTVFNFFRPDYSPSGVLTENNLVGPAFEILNSYSSVSAPNHYWEVINEGFSLGSNYRFRPDLSEFLPLASNPPALLDKLNLLLCGGSMSAQSRSIILTSLETSDPEDLPGRVRLALYLCMMSPDGAVQR